MLELYLAGFISPIFCLLLLESLRLHLMRRKSPSSCSHPERPIQRAVHMTALIGALLFVFQLWVEFSEVVYK
jgi:hypothetical protein